MTPFEPFILAEFRHCVVSLCQIVAMDSMDSAAFPLIGGSTAALTAPKQSVTVRVHEEQTDVALVISSNFACRLLVVVLWTSFWRRLQMSTFTHFAYHSFRILSKLKLRLCF